MNESEATPKQDPGKILLEELTKKPARKSIGQTVLIPFLAVITGLIIGALFIIFTTEEVYTGFQVSLGEGLRIAWETVSKAYAALFMGAFGDPKRMMDALSSGDALEIRRAFNPFLESLVTSTPYIFAGLAVGLGFRAGVFNIGGEGQIFMGAALAAYVGYSFTGLPAVLHIPLSLLGGFVGGGLWGLIPGWLKARTGGSEVINTIMMNYIAFRLSDWLLSGPMKRPDSFNPVSPTILDTAKLPRFFDNPIRFHLGFFVALLMAYGVYWLLFKSTWGFNLRTVGANPNAGKYAGINVPVNIMIAMTLSGGLAGLAGANEVLGVNYNLAMAFSSGYGFDAIALALLGNNHPLGIVLASLMFGTLRNGATRMQVASGIPIDIISILQAVILMFIAAPAIIRTIYRLKNPGEKASNVGGK